MCHSIEIMFKDLTYISGKEVEAENSKTPCENIVI